MILLKIYSHDKIVLKRKAVEKVDLVPTLWKKDEFSISTEKSYLDMDVIFNFLNKESYWANGIPIEIVMESIKNTPLCFGIYKGDPTNGPAQLVGFGRVISDLSTFAYLADVFVLKPFRGLGLSKWLMSVYFSIGV
ncbi:GNAT family N-acetyltransferase [Bacillus methanolicus]|uniref:GNAT family N-acetyltransferase n=1 Tax=Bacillus methanolicus TaxID=1471 RepID=UPI00200E516B|nr:GNAT family N-acetyltransferase [Bacillus methanolicus]